MKKIFLLTTIGALAIAGCTSFDGYDENAVKHATKEEIQKNSLEVFGTTFPSNQNWSSTTSKTISITANADLDDVVKIQLFTESPLFNEDARMLNEIAVEKGQTVQLTYDLPADVDTLIAACVSSAGAYFMQVFTPDVQKVSFASSARARTRATYDVPADGSVQLDFNKIFKSFNAERAEEAEAKGFVGVNDNTNMKGAEYTYTQWNDGSWLKDRLYQAADGNVGSWTIANGCIFRPTEDLSNEEVVNLKKIILDDFLKKEGTGSIKRNNIKKIRENSRYFSMENNYLTTDGKSPIIISPIQLNTTEGFYNQLYYYYYRPEDVKGDEAEYIKSLPKYKAIHIEAAMKAANIYDPNNKDKNKLANMFRLQQYLIPFYGDGVPNENNTTFKAIFDKGYKIGFLNRKNFNDKGYKNPGSGCVYGDKRLNFEVNHLKGHYLTAINNKYWFQTYNGTKCWGGKQEGMEWDDPRILFFCTNNKTYMCFEDGADCNFTDMIFEISGGTELIDEKVEVYNTAYTFCFEDRELGDYDMNDVIIKAQRVDATHIKYSLEACGARDRLFLKNINGNTLNDQTEIHALFNVPEGTFVNTQDGEHLPPIQEVIEVDPSFSFTDIEKQVYIFNETQGYDVKLAVSDEPPHAIMIPCDYEYPKENVCIKDANPLFLEWAQYPSTNRNWYKSSEEGMVYKESVFK